MPHVEDFPSQLREALAEVEAAGFAAPAAAVRDRCFSGYTSSSEWLGEVGVSVTGLLAAYGPAIPKVTRDKLKACLNEVAKVWPKFRVR